jgi:hypothetical protein
MDLNVIERNWTDLTDNLLDIFPQLDRKHLQKFEGRISAFVEHLAEVHDLTRREAVATLEDRLVIPASVGVGSVQSRMAAE